MKQILLTILVFVSAIVFAQTGIGTTSPHPSAKLDVSSNNKGLLPPRMTETERDAISSPADGLVIYQTDGVVGLYLHNLGSWIKLGEGEKGDQGERGFDANSSMWKFTSYLMGSGKFSTGTGFLGLSVSNHLYKDQVTGIRVAKNDALGTNLEQWLIFFDPGSIIFIRVVNDPQ